MDFVRAVKYEEGDGSIYDEKNFDLKRVKDFLRDFVGDYSGIKIVHVAGSKGKGTVSHFLARYLWQHGEKVGLFTSPCILGEREAFLINGEMISEADFLRIKAELDDFLGDNERGLSHFELLFGMVMKYFVEKKVSWMVLEVGLGGRLDATNVVLPEVSVLTSVEKEHVAILGESYEEILDEKLGIVKEGVPLVVGEQNEEVRGIIERKMAGREVVFVEEKGKTVREKNVNLVRRVLVELFGEVDEIEEEAIVGRLDVRKVSGKDVVFDMAHTMSSMKALLDFLQERFKGREFVFLVSLIKDKDCEGILGMISKLASELILTKAHEERGASLGGLKGVRVIDDPILAYEKALKELKKDQVLVVTGSHFLLKKIFAN
jgi:dihydrofolate synthase / folylpolyglutamate synthase